MSPLIQNISRRDVQWAKFKRSQMYNKIYYLRTTKFIVYQLTTNFVNVAQGIGIPVLKQYHNLQKKSIPGFPEASISTSDIVGSFAFNIFSCVFLALVFSTAVFFEVFWPEREEARCIQWTWKLSATASTFFQLAASLATTIVVATHDVRIHGVSVEEENIIRSTWKDGPALVYRQKKLAIAAVVTAWILWLCTFWSTIVMWRCYAHNNKYGPFADHVRKGRDDGGETPLSETGLRHS